MTDGSIGFDAFARAIVSNEKDDMDPIHPHLRRTLFDFKTLPADQAIASHAAEIPMMEMKESKYGYRLDPGEDVLVGIGFVTAMVYPMFYWVAPRSGLATVHGIRILNAPGTVDPDYRGEAGVLLFNESRDPFVIKKDMRINQLIFQWAVIPSFKYEYDVKYLPKTLRGSGGFGHTKW